VKERFSQRRHTGIGGLAGRRGPGDVGVRPDQQGVGRPVIGPGGTDIDAAFPAAGGFEQVGAPDQGWLPGLGSG
jgi:hypothetical protein